MYWSRDQVLSLDSTRNFTRGNPISMMASLAHLIESATVSTILLDSQKTGRIFGQVTYQPGERAAHISFITPEKQSEQPEMVRLLEELSKKAGEWGVFNLLAEIDENSAMFKSLRKSGFSVYARQKVFQLNFDEQSTDPKPCWRISTQADDIAIKNLVSSLMPPIVQSADPVLKKWQGFVFYHRDELLAFADCTFGPAGIYLKPFFHPAVQDCGDLLNRLRNHLYPLLGRPVFLAIRFFQAWVESHLPEKSQLVSNQVQMVKYLGASQRSLVYNPAFQKVEGARAEPTTSISRAAPDDEILRSL